MTIDRDVSSSPRPFSPLQRRAYARIAKMRFGLVLRICPWLALSSNERALLKAQWGAAGKPNDGDLRSLLKALSASALPDKAQSNIGECCRLLGDKTRYADLSLLHGIVVLTELRSKRSWNARTINEAYSAFRSALKNYGNVDTSQWPHGYWVPVKPGDQALNTLRQAKRRKHSRIMKAWNGWGSPTHGL